MFSEDLLNSALNVGEQLLLNGAEIHRVEDSITRICSAYDNTERVDVFATPIVIVVTLKMKDEPSVTQSRRILGQATNLKKIEMLNSLSRYVCENKPELSYINGEVDKIIAEKNYSFPLMMIATAGISCFFCILFGGTFADVIVSTIIGLFFRPLLYILDKVNANYVFTNIICSMFGGTLAIFATYLGLGDNLDIISISIIMILIPGLAMTNAIRDLISGDIITGISKISETLLIAISIAIGFAIPLWLFGGLV